MLLSSLPFNSPVPRSITRLASVALGTMAIALNVWISPALADPFRSSNPRLIDNQTEAAFESMFADGDYRMAAQLLQQASPDEPMAYAMKASLAYLSEDWESLEENFRLTLESADRLIATDPLRGYLYTAVGHFMEGAYVLSTQGTVRATPIVLNKLRQVFDNLERAEQISPTDPELNLIKGYMDLLLAVNLPFSSPDQAIERLQSYGAPPYLVNRGIALAYRDLEQEAQALQFVDQALQETPNNPELFYLKAQILRLQGDARQSLRFFQMALEKHAQLPSNLSEQIAYEFCRTRENVRGQEQDCRGWARRQVETADDDAEDPASAQGYQLNGVSEPQP